MFSITMQNLFVATFVFLVVLVAENNSAPNPHPQSNAQAMNWAQLSADSSKRVGQPQFHINGGGSGQNGRNYGVGGNVGVGVKTWESRNGRHSVATGVNLQQSFGRHQGKSWSTPAQPGFGASYKFTFGR